MSRSKQPSPMLATVFGLPAPNTDGLVLTAKDADPRAGVHYRSNHAPVLAYHDHDALTDMLSGPEYLKLGSPIRKRKVWCIRRDIEGIGRNRGLTTRFQWYASASEAWADWALITGVRVLCTMEEHSIPPGTEICPRCYAAWLREEEERTRAGLCPCEGDF